MPSCGARREAGDLEGAVTDFLRVADAAPASDIVATARFETLATGLEQPGAILRQADPVVLNGDPGGGVLDGEAPDRGEATRFPRDQPAATPLELDPDEAEHFLNTADGAACQDHDHGWEVQ